MARMKYTKPKVKAFSPTVKTFLAINPPSEDPDLLLVRYGSNKFYENLFNDVGYLDARRTFQMLENAKNHSSEDYEAARQQFLKLLGQHKAAWHPTRTDDKDLEISKIYSGNNSREYLLFMRIFPSGYRGERIVPDYMELVFHLLLGRVAFTCRRRVKIMNRGSHITVAPKSTFAVRCLDSDQTAYFVLSMNRLH